MGDNVEIKSGCVDLSTEGGNGNNGVYGSVTIENESASVAITGYNQPVLSIRSKPTINGLINTRDVLALLVSAYSNQKSIFRVWFTRDFSAITDGTQSWSDYGDGHLEYLNYDPNTATPAVFDNNKAGLTFGCRINLDDTYASTALFNDRTDIYLTAGDMLIFTLHRENGQGASAGVSFEFAQFI